MAPHVVLSWGHRGHAKVAIVAPGMARIVVQAMVIGGFAAELAEDGSWGAIRWPPHESRRYAAAVRSGGAATGIRLST